MGIHDRKIAVVSNSTPTRWIKKLNVHNNVSSKNTKHLKICCCT